MSYSAVLDLILHIHSFRNIDLFHQGLYNIRFRIYQDLEDKSYTQPAATNAVGVGAPPSRSSVGNGIVSEVNVYCDSNCSGSVRIPSGPN